MSVATDFPPLPISGGHRKLPILPGGIQVTTRIMLSKSGTGAQTLMAHAEALSIGDFAEPTENEDRAQEHVGRRFLSIASILNPRQELETKHGKKPDPAFRSR